MDSIAELEQSWLHKLKSCRWAVTISCCLVSTLSITIRQCMSIAIICMTSSSYQNVTGNQSTLVAEPFHVPWTKEVQGLVLSSYYYGFPLSPMLGGYVAGRFSGKNVVIGLMLLMCACSVAIPFAAIYAHYAVVMVLRCLVGLTSGGLMPAISDVLSHWAPRTERASMVSLVNSGQSIGNILCLLLSGLFCDIPLQGGWPFIFYIFSAINIISLVFFMFIVYDIPEQHPRIHQREVNLINFTQGRRRSSLVMPPPPWFKIIRAKAVWAILIAHITHAFIFTIIGTFVPIYMDDVHKFDIKSNGFYSSLPFIGRFFGSILSGHIADKLLTTCSITRVRKIFQTIGMIGSAPFLIALSFFTEEYRYWVIVLLTLYWTTQSATNAGFRVNHMDIAPIYAGVINGVTMMFAAFAALAAPVLTTAIVQHGYQKEWQIVFFISAGAGIFGALFFDFFASGEEQEWARDPNMDISFDVSRRSSAASIATNGTAIQKQFDGPENFEVIIGKGPLDLKNMPNLSKNNNGLSKNSKEVIIELETLNSYPMKTNCVLTVNNDLGDLQHDVTDKMIGCDLDSVSNCSEMVTIEDDVSGNNSSNEMRDTEQLPNEDESSTGIDIKADLPIEAKRGNSAMINIDSHINVTDSHLKALIESFMPRFQMEITVGEEPIKHKDDKDDVISSETTYF